MICFITALKSKVVSRNWNNTSLLYKNSMLSVLNQDCADFKMITVCHERPSLGVPPDDRFKMIEADFSPPGGVATTETMKDKWKKVTIGLIEAAKYSPDFVMIMDADDLLSRRLVSYSKSNPNSNGWVFHKGYRYRHGTFYVQIQENFNLYCGTSAIVSSRIIQFPKRIDDLNNCLLLSSGHTKIEAALRENGTPLEPLPFVGAISTVGHSENDSQYDLAMPGKGIKWQGIRAFFYSIMRCRLLTEEIKKEFSLQSLNVSGR